MTNSFRPLALVVVLGFLVFPSALSAQDTSERARFDELARTAAQQFATARIEAEAGAEQTRPTAPPVAPGTVVELALDDAVARALDRNLDIAVERLNPQTFDFAIAALDANYRPTFTSNV